MMNIQQAIQLQDGGVAESMGEGVFVLCQPSDEGPQNVVVTVEDLRRLVQAAA